MLEMGGKTDGKTDGNHWEPFLPTVSVMVILNHFEPLDALFFGLMKQERCPPVFHDAYADEC